MELGFVDDLKVFHTIVSNIDCLYLQKEMDLVQRWCESNHMSLNYKKLSITHSPAKIEFPYKLGGNVVERVHSKANLGIIKSTINCHSMSTWILSVENRISFCDLYFVVVNILLINQASCRCETPSPEADSNIVLLFGDHNSIDQIERVQEKFSRMLHFKFNIEGKSYAI